MSFCGLVNCTECESQHWVKSLFLFSSCATYTGRLPTVMQLGGFTSIRKKQIYWLLFKCCNILKQSSVCSWSGADARSDGIIVFSAPLCEAACQKQQDNKWDVCKFTEEEWFLFFFQFAAVKAFFLSLCWISSWCVSNSDALRSSKEARSSCAAQKGYELFFELLRVNISFCSLCFLPSCLLVSPPLMCVPASLQRFVGAAGWLPLIRSSRVSVGSGWRWPGRQWWQASHYQALQTD